MTKIVEVKDVRGIAAWVLVRQNERPLAFNTEQEAREYLAKVGG